MASNRSKLIVGVAMDGVVATMKAPLSPNTKITPRFSDCNLKLCDRYINNSHCNGVMVVAKQFFKKGAKISGLCDQRYPIEEIYIKPGINDFSLMVTQRNKLDLMFLGPISYVYWCARKVLCFSLISYLILRPTILKKCLLPRKLHGLRSIKKHQDTVTYKKL
ncbi:histone-lysine N-methyltransferase KMT5B-like [Aphis craccivora]|uniref:Histone-lysine N-methyltransferase KMT5B-like n=1 Tax=Aphis craccivora TaxID=307492 RepID=A0A6G0YMF7_APHCR|nr:histone-lysine N-methyltransferase KMT5B-like [Aphis craccivora]